MNQVVPTLILALAAVKTALRRLLCRHSLAVLVTIEWDGEAVYRCAACGKHVRRQL
jgi:hypothetical protein